MSETERDELQPFLERVLENLKKHGFPERKVSFPIERLYDAAYAKGLNFNKVLEALAGLGIAHEKTPEKVIFWSTTHDGSLAPPPGFAGMDLSGMKDLSPEQMMAAAAEAMQKMSPDQMTALRAMVDNMSDEEREQMIEHAKKLGLA